MDRREFLRKARELDLTRVVHRNYSELVEKPIPQWQMPQSPKNPPPSPEKCSRTVCPRPHANCISTVDGRPYCRSCAHKINSYNAGLITLPTVDPDK